MKIPQLSDCCKAYIRLTGEERPNAFACVKCGRIIGTELPQPTTNNLEDIPMGVSQWLEYGKKYKYYDYFRNEIRQADKESLIKMLPGEFDGEYYGDASSAYEKGRSDYEQEIKQLIQDYYDTN